MVFHCGLICILFLFFNYMYLFFGCADSPLLLRLLSSCREQGLLSRCHVRASGCSDLSCCKAQASIVVACGLSSCSSQVLERRRNSGGAWVLSLHGLWGLLGPGIQLTSPSLAGRFFTTEPPGKPDLHFLNHIFCGEPYT